MEGWDLEKVKELKAQYEAAGVTSTSSYHFLSSIVHAGAPPRGRGITWLQQLLASGAPSDINAMLARAERLHKEVFTADLERIIQMIKSSGRVEKWQHEKIDAVEAALEKGWIDLTPERLAVLLQIQEISKGRRIWWANRPSQHRRFMLIYSGLTHQSGRMLQADVDFVTELFGPAYRELTKPSFVEGDLVKVKRRFHPDGGLLGVVISGPAVRGEDVVYDVLAGDEGIISVARPNLMKRLK
jgi:hypothetical protein